MGISSFIFPDSATSDPSIYGAPVTPAPWVLPNNILTDNAVVSIVNIAADDVSETLRVKLNNGSQSVFAGIIPVGATLTGIQVRIDIVTASGNPAFRNTRFAVVPFGIPQGTGDNIVDDFEAVLPTTLMTFGGNGMNFNLTTERILDPTLELWIFLQSETVPSVVSIDYVSVRLWWTDPIRGAGSATFFFGEE